MELPPSLERDLFARAILVVVRRQPEAWQAWVDDEAAQLAGGELYQGYLDALLSNDGRASSSRSPTSGVRDRRSYSLADALFFTRVQMARIARRRLPNGLDSTWRPIFRAGRALVAEVVGGAIVRTAAAMFEALGAPPDDVKAVLEQGLERADRRWREECRLAGTEERLIRRGTTLEWSPRDYVSARQRAVRILMNEPGMDTHELLATIASLDAMRASYRRSLLFARLRRHEDRWARIAVSSELVEVVSGEDAPPETSEPMTSAAALRLGVAGFDRLTARERLAIDCLSLGKWEKWGSDHRREFIERDGRTISISGFTKMRDRILQKLGQPRPVRGRGRPKKRA